jgi:hypothetical protein
MVGFVESARPKTRADRSEITYARAQRLKLLTELDVRLITKNLPVR